MNIDKIEQIEREILSGGVILFDDALQLIDTENCEKLQEVANRVREFYCGNDFDTCSIMNARSGKCSEDCKWCAQSKFHKTAIDIYPLISAKSALAMADNNHTKGVRKFSLVTSGRDMSDKDIDTVCKIYDSIGEMCNISLCASMGLLNRSQLEKLYESNVRYYHCNLETAPSFFGELCSTHTQEEKLQSIGWAREVGMKVCSGGIVGMGESLKQRVEFAFLLSEQKVDSIPINILNPIKGTPLENVAPLTEREILNFISVMRLVNPRAQIRFAGGRGALSVEAQRKAYNGGVNGALVGDLLTTTGSTNIETDMKIIKAEGFNVE